MRQDQVKALGRIGDTTKSLCAEIGAKAPFPKGLRLADAQSQTALARCEGIALRAF